MYQRIRPFLLRMDPEAAHNATIRLMQFVGAVPPLAYALRRNYFVGQHEPIELFGLQFKNRVGLASGYDKDGLAWRGLTCLGFGHIEIGTVTVKPQQGNPKPRVFRLVEDEALINRMGFPGRGAEFVLRRIKGKLTGGLVLGVNIGINKDTPLEQAARDYQRLMEMFNPAADYIAINISSPNTTGLRGLQSAEALEELLSAITQTRKKPLLIKLGPDLSEKQLDEALDVILRHGVNGIIATNTTVNRTNLRSKHAGEVGGLSGAPLSALARKVIGHIYTHTMGKLPIVAVGGIMSRQDADAAINAGASLVQVYTGLIYKGPGLVKEILKTD